VLIIAKYNYYEPFSYSTRDALIPFKIREYICLLPYLTVGIGFFIYRVTVYMRLQYEM
jgi:hypothetical protein